MSDGRYAQTWSTLHAPAGTVFLRLAVHYALGRAIPCEHCGEPFVVLESELLGGDVPRGGHKLRAGHGGEHLEDGPLAARAVKDITAALRSRVRGRGDAGACPSCGRYQADMVAASRRRAERSARTYALVAGLVALGVGLLFSVALVISPTRPQPSFPALATGAAVLAAAAAGVAYGVGRSRALTAESRAEDDPRSMTQDAFREHVARCREAGRDPLLAWAAEAGARVHPDDVEVDLGLAGDVPPELEHVTAAEDALAEVRLTFDRPRQRLRLRDRIEKPDG